MEAQFTERMLTQLANICFLPNCVWNVLQKKLTFDAKIMLFSSQCFLNFRKIFNFLLLAKNRYLENVGKFRLCGNMQCFSKVELLHN